VVALGALLLWGVGALVPGNHLCRTVMPVRVVMGLLVGSTLLSYGVAHVHHVPGVELLASDRAVLQVLSWAGVALLAAEGLRDRRELYAVLRVVVGAVAVMAFVGLLQFRAGIDLAVHFSRIPGLHLNAEYVAIQDRSGFNRPAGTAGHPIEFGSVIAMALPIALHLARFDRARPTIRRWLPVVAIAIGVPVAVSRSAILAALVAAVVVFVGLERRYRPRALAAAAGFLLVTYVTTPGLLGILRDLFTHFSTDSSITYRTDDYETVEQYVLESPVLGRGPGTFLPANSHTILDNQYLMTAIELGLWGLVIVVCYLSAAAFLGRGARHASTDPTVRDLGQALAATGLAGAVAAVTFDGFSFFMYAGLIPLCTGAAGALRAMVRNGAWKSGAEPTDSEPSDDDMTWLSSFAVVWPSEEPDVLTGATADVVVGPTGAIAGAEEAAALAEPGTAPAPRVPVATTTVGDARTLRRAIALAGATVVLAVLLAWPFTSDNSSSGEDLDVATGQAITPVTIPSTSTSTSASTSTSIATTPPPLRSRLVTKTAGARAGGATTPTTGASGAGGAPSVSTTVAPRISGPMATTTPGSTASPTTVGPPTPTTTPTTGSTSTSTTTTAVP
jgi:O-antigen ligase